MMLVALLSMNLPARSTLLNIEHDSDRIVSGNA
jgi:hypothetical protein